MLKRFCFTLVLTALCGNAPAAIPTGVTCTPVFETNAANRLNLPVWVGEIPGHAGVLLVAEQGRGTPTADLYVLQKEGAANTKKLFVSLAVRHGLNEMGLLGVAFHPKFAQNGKYYVHYNPDNDAGVESSVVDERTADNTFLKDSGNPPRRIITVDQANSQGHKGGGLAFGADGYLYFGLGDGENFREPQRKTSLFGKILRLNVDSPAGGLGYSIPSDNPFVGDADPAVKKEIFAYGLRNPFRFSFDAATGDLWVGDVGLSSREEIDVVRKGGNYGWSDVEGDICAFNPSCNPLSFLPPVAVLGRTQSACIIGGYVFHGSTGSGFNGVYIFADYGGHTLWGLTHKNYVKDEMTLIGECPQTISSLGTDAAGNLYAVGHGSGAIYKLTHAQLVTSTVKMDMKPKQKLPPRHGGWFGSQLQEIRVGMASLDVFRHDGRKVFSVAQGQPLDESPLEQAEPGIYIVRTFQGDTHPTGFLVVKNRL